MAAIRSLNLSIFFLIAAAATTADEAYFQCYAGKGGDVALEIMKSLVHDLTVKLPDRQKTNYCNKATSSDRRLTMFGFAECLYRDSRGAESMRACIDCLPLAGNMLIDQCGYTGTGYAWGDNSACYFKVGYSLKKVCPDGTY